MSEEISSEKTSEEISFAYFAINVPLKALSSAYDKRGAKWPTTVDLKKQHQSRGFACVSLKRPPKDSKSDSYVAGISFCSPLDVTDALGRINKKKARKIAEGRMRCSRPGRSIELNYPRNESFKLTDVHKAILKKALSDDFVVIKRGDSVSYAPRWAKEAINLGEQFEITSNRR